jgi:hypothetical protein
VESVNAAWVACTGLISGGATFPVFGTVDATIVALLRRGGDESDTCCGSDEEAPPYTCSERGELAIYWHQRVSNRHTEVIRDQGKERTLNVFQLRSLGSLTPSPVV